MRSIIWSVVSSKSGFRAAMTKSRERSEHARRAKKTPKPPKPWDVPPPPLIGDTSEDIIFTSVGRALNKWESLESELGAVFAILLGLNDHTEPALRAYAAVRTFRGRLDMLEAAAEANFLRYPSATLKTQFESVATTSNNYSARRNEIAHGLVQKCPRLGIIGPGFLLGPYLYSGTKRHIHATKNAIIPYNSIPSYIYSSKEIDALADHFKLLASGANALWTNLAMAHVKRRKKP